MKRCDLIEKTMGEKLDELKDEINEVKIAIAKLPTGLIEKLDARYADKKTEQTVDKLIWLIIGAVIVGALNLIWK